MRDYSEDVRAVSMALRTMHRSLMNAEMEATEEGPGPATPGARMQALLHDPALAWLKPVSNLMVVLDGLVSESDAIDEAAAARVRRDAETLFGPSPEGEQHAVQRTMANLTYRHPEVVMALGDLRRALKKLPGRPDEA